MAPRVLIVDDEPLARERLSTLVALVSPGAELREAGNGEEAVEAIGAWSPTVVFLDVQMPGMDGYVATRHLRDGGLACPIIALTAHALKSVYDKCMTTGFDDYLAKPIEKKHLIDSVSHWIATAEA